MAESPSQTATPEQFEYRAEMKQLLHLIVHSLYTHREIFLRELISNASDALNKVRFRMLTDRNVVDPDAALQITITADSEAQTLTIADTGIGMTKKDLVERIGTVASSGTLAFLEEVRQSDKPIDGQLIGQFGVGFYAAFMVADTITIETRHADPDSPAWRWTSDGGGQFTIEPIDRTARGTTITLHLKDDADEFAQEFRVRQIIQKYSNFVDFPIFLGGSQANKVKALWRKPKGEITDEELNEFYKFISNDYTDPLGHLHLHIEGMVAFRALLFIPATAPPGLFREEYQRRLHLYAAGVFIQDDCEALLPEYLRFVSGVVDTEDLPLNVSREVTQQSPVLRKINQILTSKVLDLLAEWAADEPETYTTFFTHYGSLFKLGLNADPGNQAKILDLVRFESTHTDAGTVTSLQGYVDRMAEGQAAIYYALGEHRETLERSPNLEYFQKNDLEVLLLTDPVDVFTVPYLDGYRETPFQSVEQADLDLEQDAEAQQEALTTDETEALLARFKQVLGDQVEDVVASKRLVASAATLVRGDKGLDVQMERMMKMMQQEVAPSAKVLEVNPAHPLIKNLARLLREEAQASVLDASIRQLYEGALLLDGNLAQPAAFVERMTDLMVAATQREGE